MKSRALLTTSAEYSCLLFHSLIVCETSGWWLSRSSCCSKPSVPVLLIKTYCEGGSAVTPHARCVCCLSKSSFCCLASFGFDSSRSSL
ncbi:hypothetical protein PF005_g30821 [Phytophthora fragariae]|nr:hypothetical protein PF003_g20215 [Phytophthora fragariae]KAE8918695.1 hypothetical protein PF009_g30992 [Phytophthora fragariae]KAE9061961.1 hypothetical protein PF007_g30076 [Phytophthora fragariae]KAE9162510.1 hypothetical protein PF005_g30821 [Phytophthora fragariae]